MGLAEQEASGHKGASFHRSLDQRFLKVCNRSGEIGYHRIDQAMKPIKEIKIQRPKREKVTREEALKRMKSFPKRKEKLIAAIREGTKRDIHS